MLAALAPVLVSSLILVWFASGISGSGPRSEAILLNTQAGPAEYSRCLLCGSVRLKYANGAVDYPVKSKRFDQCNHAWAGNIDAWSRRRLTTGDVLLVGKSGTYNAIRVIRAPEVGNAITFEWFHQPNNSKARFDDSGVQSGVVRAAGKIAFKNVDIQYQNGRIWYDFYFGGIDGATTHAKDPHYIAFAGKVGS